jgi:HlyD family secretion protein
MQARRGYSILAFPLALGALLIVHPALVAGAEGPSKIAGGLRVTVVPAQQQCLPDTLEMAGRLVARDEALIRPDVEGLQVAQVLVEEGDRVNEGQILARLSRPDGQSGTLPPAAAIKSPAAGVISYRSAQINGPASARGEPLFRLIVGGEIELQAEVPAQRVSKLAAKQAAIVEIPGRGEISGYVRGLPSAIDAKTQMASARIFLGDQKLPLGAFARALVTTGESCGPGVPLAAVLYDNDGALVQVIRDDHVETRRVQVGLFADGRVEIRDGLKGGEMVVARSGAFLREGDTVRAVVKPR